MKNLKFTAIAIITTLSIKVFSQTVQAPYEVATWHGFTSAAICYTFDDGCANQFDIAIPEFNKYDFKLTMFTISSQMNRWSELKAAADSGHEIGNHTKSHSHLGTLSVDAQRTEYTTCNNLIFNNIKRKAITLAYPFCEKADDTLARRLFVAARGCQGFINAQTPADWMNVSSIVCGNIGSIKTYADLKNNFETAAKSKGWSVLLFHGIDNDGGYSPIPSKTLKISLEYLSMRKSKFWVTSFGNAALYARERNCTSVAEKSSTDTLITLQVTDTLVDSVFNYPVTIRRPLPAEWPSALVKQNNDTVFTRIIKVDNTVYLMFDAVTDAGDITISKSNNIVVPEIDTIPPDSVPAEPKVITEISKKQNKGFNVWQVNNELQFTLPEVTSNNIFAALYDLKGSLVLRNKLTGISGSTLTFDLPAGLKSSSYILKISDGKSYWSKQVILK